MLAPDKFIALGPDDSPLSKAAGMVNKKDDGFVELTDSASVEAFITACAAICYWKRASSHRHPSN